MFFLIWGYYKRVKPKKLINMKMQVEVKLNRQHTHAKALIANETIKYIPKRSFGNFR